MRAKSPAVLSVQVAAPEAVTAMCSPWKLFASTASEVNPVPAVVGLLFISLAAPTKRASVLVTAIDPVVRASVASVVPVLTTAALEFAVIVPVAEISQTITSTNPPAPVLPVVLAVTLVTAFAIPMDQYV